MRISGKIVKGHGIASGARGCEEMGGTINAQRPVFKELGFDMDAYNLYNGTINLDITPYQYECLNSFRTYENVKWHEDWPEETFSLFNCVLHINGKDIDAFVYYPHPETKPIEFLGKNMFEILAPKIEDISYDQEIDITINTDQIEIKAA